jgi:hypothetical protein
MKQFHVVLLFAALLLVPCIVTSLQAQTTTTPAPTTTPTANISSRTTMIAGVPVGEVLVGDNVVFRIREAAGGYTAGERANVVAGRMTSLVSQGFGWQNLSVGTINNQTALLMGDNLLITADPGQARTNGVTPVQLATTWMENTQTALRGNTVVAVAGSTEQFPDWTDATTKIVPIVAVGTPGVQIGLAQVTGPRERVESVRAVLELDLIFQRAARIRVYVPSTQLASLNRVQGVAVSALLQYQLFEF